MTRQERAWCVHSLADGWLYPDPTGACFEAATKCLGELQADFVDEHYYAKPEWFRQNAGRYDSYPRTGPKIFADEYVA